MQRLLFLLMFGMYCIEGTCQASVWQERNSPKFSSVNAIAVNANTGRVYVSCYSLIAYSDDMGETWNILPTENYFIADATSIDVDEASGRVVVGTGSGVCWTDDNGASLWNRDNIQTNSVSGFGVPVKIVKINNITGTIFAGLFKAPGNNPQGNFMINSIGINPFPANGAPWQYNNLLAVVDYEIDDSGYVYMVYNTGVDNALSDGIYQSKDDGNSWTFYSVDGLDTVKLNDMAFNSQGTAFYATTKGVFRKEANQHFAVPASGDLPVTSILKIEIDKANNVIYVLANGRLYKSMDGGVSYNLASNSFDNSYLSVIAADSGRCYAGSITKAIYKHEELLGVDFRDISGILQFSNNEQLAIASNGTLLVRCGNGVLERSLDDGFVWEPILMSSSQNDFLCTGNFVIDAADNLYVPTNELGQMVVYASSDLGNTFTKIDLPPSIDAVASNYLFTIKGAVFLANRQKVFRYANGNWSSLFNGDSVEGNVASIDKAYRNYATGRYVMIVNSNGGFSKEIVYSDNSGATWTKVPFQTTTTLPATGEYFYWLGTSPATFSTEIWKGDAFGINWVKLELPTGFVPHSSLVYANQETYCIAQDISNSLPTFTYLKTANDFTSTDELLAGIPAGIDFRHLAIGNQGDLYGYSPQNLYKYEAVSGLEDLRAAQVRLLNNPVTDNVCLVALNPISQLQIYSALGELVYTKDNYQPGTQLDCNLHSGLYFIRCKTGTDDVVIKMLIQP